MPDISRPDFLEILAGRQPEGRILELLGRGPIRLPDVSRFDLPAISAELEHRRGAEIGVWEGGFSAMFCAANSQLEWLAVDPWFPHPAWLDTKNQDAATAGPRLELACRAARERLARFPKCDVWREFSTNAAQRVPNASLDIVFIDGDHGHASVLADLLAWVPKVRKGGIVSGHDYHRNPKKPTIQVLEAVDNYVAAHRIDPLFVLAADRTPSFLWIA